MRAVLGRGLGGPEQRVDAAVADGLAGRFGKGDGVDGGVEGGAGRRVAEGAAGAVRVLEAFLPAEDLEDDAAGRVQAAGGQPGWGPGGGDKGFGFRSRVRGWWFGFTALGWMVGVADTAPSQRRRSDQEAVFLPLPSALRRAE